MFQYAFVLGASHSPPAAGMQNQFVENEWHLFLLNHRVMGYLHAGSGVAWVPAFFCTTRQAAATVSHTSSQSSRSNTARLEGNI